MSERDRKIGPTAHYTAYAWKQLGLRYAEPFASAEGRALYWSFRLAGEWIARLVPGTPLLVDVLAYRHRTIDAELSHQRPDTVVELGAGLSRRGITAVLDLGVERYVELDLPHMIEEKRARLSRAGLSDRAGDRLELIAQDLLAPDLATKLTELLAGARRAVVIAEGVLGYFPLAERALIVGSVASALETVTEGSFVCDLRDDQRAAKVRGGVKVLRAAVRLVTRGRGLREDFASEHAIRAFFAEHGLIAEPVRDVPRDLEHLAMPVGVWRARPSR